jgi:hypothetical protein
MGRRKVEVEEFPDLVQGFAVPRILPSGWPGSQLTFAIGARYFTW